MLSGLRKLFGSKDNGTDIGARFPDVRWLDPDENPWRVPLLDVQSVTRGTTSVSQDPICAMNAVSFGHDDGTGFIGQAPPVERMIAADLRYRIDPILIDGALYLPSEMEHKWALYFHDNRIICVRSWQRKVLVVAETRTESSQLVVETIHGTFFADDEAPEFTIRVLDFLIRSHALSINHPAPLPAEFGAGLQAPTNLDAGALWCMSCYGNLAVLASVEPLEIEPPDEPLRTYSLLHMAAARSDLSTIRSLLDRGIPIDLPDRDGQSPLHWGLSASTLDPAILLLESGANVDYRDPDGVTALKQMVQREDVARAQLLLDSHADPNAVDVRGYTPLQLAAYLGNAELTSLLLKRGADPNKETDGQSAMSFAVEGRHSKVISILSSYSNPS